MSEQPTADQQLKVIQREGVWIVEDCFGKWVRIGSDEKDRYVAEEVREAMAYMYRRGHGDAFSELRRLIGAKS